VVQATRKCSVNFCEEAPHARGFCSRHYQQQRSRGAFAPLPERRPKICEIEECGELAWARNLCGNHYQAWRRKAKPKRVNPSRKRYMNPDESFQARTKWQDDCLVWTGYTQRDGYGQMRINGRGKRVHRYAWERVYGEIPSDMVIDHICHNRTCVNIDHLRLATRGENSAHRSGPDLDNSSGHRNVYWDVNRWQVSVIKDGVKHRIGRFKRKQDAIDAAEKARQELFGEFNCQL